MRAIVMTATGGPDVLVTREVPVPSPAHGELLVRTEATPVLFVETQIRSGVFPLPTGLPAVFGTQSAGVVTEVGPDVDRALVGTHVVVTGMGIGAHAESVCAPAESAVSIPGGLSSVDAAAVVMGGSVALSLLETARLSGDDTVLIEAAGTGVGGYLTQLARSRGAGRIIATAGSPENRERARGFGADIVIDHTEPDWADRLPEALRGDTIDIAFESVGGGSSLAVLDAMTPLSGRMLYYGMLSGAPAAVTSSDLLARGLSLTGCSGPAWLARVTSVRSAVLELAANGAITPIIDSVIGFDDAGHAHEQIELRRAKGMFVLTPHS
ncbi:zinc-binding alcohol dehydrogenase family protein [Rhodococcus sp. NPDC059234]|uniref:quinone oxidoreductase family protein n=1 Tax=Rhodococcus sp. NPDC059234 TaxID=3346781 RepID=UPI003673608B